MLHIPRSRRGVIFSYLLVFTTCIREARTYIKDKVVTGDHNTISFFSAVTNMQFLLLEGRNYFFYLYLWVTKKFSYKILCV